MSEELEESDLRFPVLALKGAVAHVYSSWDEVTRCTGAALRNRWFNNLVLIDTSGNQIVLNGARKVGSIGPFWGFNFLLGRKLRVIPLKKEAKGVISIEQVRQSVRKTIAADRTFWDSGGKLEEFEVQLAKIPTTGELIQLLANIGEPR